MQVQKEWLDFLREQYPNLGHCDLRETDKYLQANYDFFQHDQTLITDYARKNCIFPEVIDE